MENETLDVKELRKELLIKEEAYRKKEKQEGWERHRKWVEEEKDKKYQCVELKCSECSGTGLIIYDHVHCLDCGSENVSHVCELCDGRGTIVSKQEIRQSREIKFCAGPWELHRSEDK